MFEALEARRLMSVVAVFADGTKATQSGSGSLVVKAGSHAANNLIVAEATLVPGREDLGAGTWLVQDLNTSEEAIFSNVNTAKRVVVQGGHTGDVLNFLGATNGSQITAGSGNDTINLLNLSSKADKVDAGKGNDTINLIFSNNATLIGGPGDDVFNVDTGNVCQTVTIYDYSGTNTIIQAGDGNDIIYLFDFGTITVDGGKGIDQITDYTGFFFFDGIPTGLKNVEVFTTDGYVC